MRDLTNQVAIVTGASTPNGIGRAIARRYAAAGASLFLVSDRTAEQLADAVTECRAIAGAGRVESKIMDLGQAGEPEAMVAEADRLFGRVDILVNNAGIRAPYDFGDYARGTFDRMIAVNLAAAFFASQAVVPLMRRQGGGRIIHIASQMGQVAGQQTAMYGMTKAALIHLTKSMAVELCRDNIIVNSLSPGPIATQPLRDLGLQSMRELFGDPAPQQTAGPAEPPAWNSQHLAKVPLGRLGHIDEIADVALYLASDSPAFMMGQDVVVDGGYLLQ